MNIWPVKRLGITLNCTQTQLLEFLNEYLAKNAAEVIEKESDALAGHITENSFRFWRRYSAGFGQPLLVGTIDPIDQQTRVEIDFKVSILSRSYLWIASILSLSFIPVVVLKGEHTIPEFVILSLLLLSPLGPYALIRNGFLHEQRTLEQEFLKFLESNCKITVN